MKTFIVINDKNIVVDVSSHEENLSPSTTSDVLNTTIELPWTLVKLGDEYDLDSKSIIPRPENYPKLSIQERAEEQIQAEIRRLAVASLKTKGLIPANFVDNFEVAEKVITEEP